MGIKSLKTYIFYCSNSLDSHLFSDLHTKHAGDVIKPIGLPCSGKIDIPYLIKAFESGADGVTIVTCRTDECHNFEGSLRAHKRAEAVEELLKEIGVAAGRMAVFECNSKDPASVLKEIGQFIERVRKMPPMYSRSSAANKQESTVA